MSGLEVFGAVSAAIALAETTLRTLEYFHRLRLKYNQMPTHLDDIEEHIEEVKKDAELARRTISRSHNEGKDRDVARIHKLLDRSASCVAAVGSSVARIHETAQAKRFGSRQRAFAQMLAGDKEIARVIKTLERNMQHVHTRLTCLNHSTTKRIWRAVSGWGEDLRSSRAEWREDLQKSREESREDFRRSREDLRSLMGSVEDLRRDVRLLRDEKEATKAQRRSESNDGRVARVETGGKGKFEEKQRQINWSNERRNRDRDWEQNRRLDEHLSIASLRQKAGSSRKELKKQSRFADGAFAVTAILCIGMFLK